MYTSLTWNYKDRTVDFLANDIVNKAWAVAHGLGSATILGNGTYDSPYRDMSTIADWMAAANNTRAPYTWYHVGGRLLRRDTDPDYPDYISDWGPAASKPAKEPGNEDHKNIPGALYKPEGPSYKDFKSAFPGQYTGKQIAGQMRSVLRNGKADWNILPVLVGAFFIAEVYRNRLSMLSGLMLLDILEREKPIEGKAVSWLDVLWREQGEKDIYDKQMSDDKTGGLHPMAHYESVKQAAKPPQDMSVLTNVRQKEASLTIAWLYHSQTGKVAAVGSSVIKAPDAESKSVSMATNKGQQRSGNIENWKLKVSKYSEWKGDRQQHNPLKDSQRQILDRAAVLNVEIGRALKNRAANFDCQIPQSVD